MPHTFTVNTHSAPDVPVSDRKTESKSTNNDQDQNETKAPNIIGRSPHAEHYTTSLANGFVTTLCTAYNQHYHLTIRPDDVWLAILIQFACYLEKNAEELRHLFVEHKGKKKLTVRSAGSLRNAPYDKMCLAMTEQIAENLKDATVKEWAIPDFSTSTWTDKVVGSVALMATMKQYFAYRWELCCGLSNVTLSGTVADWEQIEKKVARLLEFDNQANHMKKWVDLLAPVCAQFTAAVKGNPDLEWWKRICSHHGNGSGPRYLSGWLTTFCAFSENGTWKGDQREVRGNWGNGNYSDKNSYAPEGWIIINTHDIPSGCVKCDVELSDMGQEYKCELVAGHSGMAVPEKNMVSPHLSWVFRIKTEKPLDNKRSPFSEEEQDDIC
jgi:hypothetical protein